MSHEVSESLVYMFTVLDTLVMMLEMYGSPVRRQVYSLTECSLLILALI